ncbi:MAG: enoyl-CoA hydratase/isomerase family protein [Desulfobacterales bacterium]|nr:enoyl-CoA hydratase/isomerase family protein [Desulfobacterales bacterium]MBF0397948.1 enoyl-CoA hydratase/isomerase family protein [Desulfobacterales bacterium]
MDFIEVHKNKEIATLILKRGKVNALNGKVVDEINELLKTLEDDPEVRGIIITGAGKFFSFGFDIPEFLSFTKMEFTEYLIKFTDLYSYIFIYPKPVVAALNGHTIAGACMLSLACDYRVMVTGKAKISLNEISFGSSVFLGSSEMLKFWVGSSTATEILFSGAMYTAEEANNMGLVHEIASENNLMDIAINAIYSLASKHPKAFTSIKSLMRKKIVDEIILKEKDSIKEFVDIWYSEDTWAALQNIKII